MRYISHIRNQRKGIPMGLYTGTVKGMSRAPYRTQVLIHMMNAGLDDRLSATEEAKITRVQRFLSAYDCAKEIEAARERVT
jgi:hypothetical protein